MQKRRLKAQHVEAFRAVFLSGTMTAAAQKMHTSQPQVSRLIGQLEQIAGFQLFDRSGSRLSPTVDGSRYFEEVERMFISLAGLENAAAEIRSFSAGRLRIAAMPRLGATLLTDAVTTFKADHPDVLVTLHSGTSSAIHTWVQSGFCDVGLVMLYRQVSDVAVQLLSSSTCVALVPAGHRLARSKLLRAEDFQGESFISFPAGNPFRQRVDEVFQASRVQRHIVAESDLGASVCSLVGAGLGSSILNSLAADQDRKAYKIEVRPFMPEISFDTALIYPPYTPVSRLVSTFATYVQRLASPQLSKLG